MTKSYSKFILLLSTIVAISCNNKSNNVVQKRNSLNYRLDFSTIESKFKYENLSEFSIDTIQWDKRSNFYTKLDSISFFEIYQDTTNKEYLGTFPESIDLDFFYSKQKSKRGLIECTILTQREGEYCDRILYNIYDQQGKIISSFRVAGSNGDGGYYEKAKGKFLNDSIYELLSEDNYKTKDIEKSNIITTSRVLTIIKPNGTIVQKDSTLKIETK